MDSWMFRIIRNAWIDEARSRGRRARVFAPEEDGLAVGADPSPNLEARADLSRAQAAMQRLPAEQREAIALVLVEGLGYAEAADVLAIPIGTLTSRLLRSEEHTSELQSLMRISYADFCLKKNNIYRSL